MAVKPLRERRWLLWKMRRLNSIARRLRRWSNYLSATTSAWTELAVTEWREKGDSR